MPRAALLLAAAALNLCLPGFADDVAAVVPAAVEDDSSPHVPRGHYEWNYTLQPHMLTRSLGYEVGLCFAEDETSLVVQRNQVLTRCAGKHRRAATHGSQA